MNAVPLRLLSYNIHQGLTLARKRLTFAILKESIKKLDADIVLLQEVAGSDLDGEEEIRAREEDPLACQLEALADEMWPYYAYGKNSIFSGGFHGNAILSRFPIDHWDHVDITVGRFAKRGFLHAEIGIPDKNIHFHVIALHLGLLQVERHLQMRFLFNYVEKHIPPEAPLFVGGDFNDWREVVSKKFRRRLKMAEAFFAKHKKHARTFPSRYPVLCLDRIYFRGAKLHSVSKLSGRPWVRLSDHLPLTAEFKVTSREILK